jgi:NDP-sugar pyrophosphorylase family protein
MTNQAVFLIDPQKDKNFLFHEINAKPFIHYQLSYLAENLFKKIVFIEVSGLPSLKEIIGDSYLNMDIQYIELDDQLNESDRLKKAFEIIDEIYAFVFDAHHYFRLNLQKADDFRRMRDCKMLHIGKKAENYYRAELTHLSLDEKGAIEEIQSKISKEKADTFFSGTWLINRIYFQKNHHSTHSSLLNILENMLPEKRMFCLACRQYLMITSSEKDLEKVSYDITEYHYQ